MENNVCKVHSTKKASHYCCIDKVLFCESCSKSHEGHLIYTLKEVEELKKTGVDLLKNLNNQNTKQTSTMNNKPSGPKIDLNALAASFDKKEDKNQVSSKPVNTVIGIANVNSVSSSNNNVKLNNEQNNSLNKPSNLVKSNTVSNLILTNSANQDKNVNANKVENTSFTNTLNSFTNNQDKGKEAMKEEKKSIEIGQPSIDNINQNHLRAPKNELQLVGMIIQDNKDETKNSNYNTYCAPSNNTANKINNLNDQINKNIVSNKQLVVNEINKSDVTADKNVKNNIEIAAKQEDKVNILPNEEKKFSIKDRLNQLNSNNKTNENNIINKQTTLKQDEKKKENIQAVNLLTSADINKKENKDNIKNFQDTSKVDGKSEVKIENKTVIEVKAEVTLKVNVDVKEEAQVIEQTPKSENKVIEETKVSNNKEVSESVIQNKLNEEKKQLNTVSPVHENKEVVNPTAIKNLIKEDKKEISTSNPIQVNKEVMNPTAIQNKVNEEKKEISTPNPIQVNKEVVNPIEIKNAIKEDKKDLNSPNLTQVEKEVVNPIAIKKAANEDKKDINSQNPIQVSKEVVKAISIQKAEVISEVIESPKSILNVNNKNTPKDADKGNLVQNVLKTLDENNVKSKPEVKLNHCNTLKPTESKIAEKLNSLANPIKEEKASKIEIKEETVPVSGNKNENFNKMKEMLGKRLSAVMGEKDLKPKASEQPEQTNSNPTNVFKHTETSELKEVRKDNFKKAFADLNTCFINRTKPQEAPSINIPQISKQTGPSSKAPPVPNNMMPKAPMINLPSKPAGFPMPPPVPNKLIPQAPMINLPSIPSALSLPLPPPINLADISTIPDRSKDSSVNKSSEGKTNIPKAPPLILVTSEKKVVKNEFKNQTPKEPKKEVQKILPPPEPKKISMLDELKKKVSLRNNNPNVKEP